jgi:hypothetical protein
MASGTGKYKYEADSGNIYYARTDDSEALAAIRGTEPTGNVTESMTFRVSKNTKEVGCKPRHCLLYPKGTDVSEGCILNPKAASKQVVVLKKAANVPARGTPVTVNGREYVVGSVIGEQMR